MYWPSSLVCGSVPLSASSIVPGSLWGLSLWEQMESKNWYVDTGAQRCHQHSTLLTCRLPGLANTHQYSSPPVMHFSYTGPSSSRWLGKISSLCMMMVLMTSLTCAWHATGSCPSGIGIRVGPKQIARLYESIMFSSLYWERLRDRTGGHKYCVYRLCCFLILVCQLNCEW